MKEKAIYDKEKNEENLNELLVRYETSENEKVILEQRNKIQTTKSKVTTLVVTLLLALTITLLSILKYKEKANMLSLLMKEQEQVKLQEQKIDSLQHTIEKLNAEQSDNHLLTEFKHLFDTKQIFKQTDISLDKLAKQMNSNTTYVSKLINSHYHCNLKTLINQYRINFCIESMGKEQDTPLKALANQAGFQSLSSFYATFKKHTGSTPAEYRSKLKF